MVEYWSYISRDDLRNNPDKIFLFGDNVIGKGYGGQAKEMRDEPNAIGIPTKKLPSNVSNAFFTDREFWSNKEAIDKAFAKVPKDKTIVIPSAGLGTGLAMLEVKAPKTYIYLLECIKKLEKGDEEMDYGWQISPIEIMQLQEYREGDNESIGYERNIINYSQKRMLMHLISNPPEDSYGCAISDPQYKEMFESMLKQLGKRNE